jgi:DNA primase
MMLDQLAKLARTDLDAITQLSDGKPRAATAPVAAAPKPRRDGAARPSPVRTAITCLLHQPALALAVENPARLRGLDVNGTALLIDIIELLHAHPHLNSAALIEHWRDGDEGRQLVKLARLPHLVPPEGLAAEFTGAIARLDDALKRQRFAELTSKGALTPDEKSEIRRLHAEIGHTSG